MQALETTAPITNHRLVVEHSSLPGHADNARIIVLWETPSDKKTAGFGSLPVNTADLDAGFTPEAEAEVASLFNINTVKQQS